jgi:hypothetical protein
VPAGHDRRALRQAQRARRAGRWLGLVHQGVRRICCGTLPAAGCAPRSSRSATGALGRWYVIDVHIATVAFVGDLDLNEPAIAVLGEMRDLRVSDVGRPGPVWDQIYAGTLTDVRQAGATPRAGRPKPRRSLPYGHAEPGAEPDRSHRV